MAAEAHVLPGDKNVRDFIANTKTKELLFQKRRLTEHLKETKEKEEENVVDATPG